MKLLETTALTFVQVVVFPLPCRPTNIIMLPLPFVGCQAGTPGSMRRQSSLKTADWIRRRRLRPAAMSSKLIADLCDGMCMCVCGCGWVESTVDCWYSYDPVWIRRQKVASIHIQLLFKPSLLTLHYPATSSPA